MDRLFDLLTELSIDPFKQAAFVADRQDELLTEEERAALRQPGPPGAQGAIAGGAWTRCAGIFDPGPDPEDDPDPPDAPSDSPDDGQTGRHAAARGSVYHVRVTGARARI
ncbi:hypothetical protein BE17_21020 [Sorangium cellulosum]|uniref:Uncharacterized protein n=1 Tax=Sorangium cellulosum TaxID=56 RepID=A0A150R1F7_SORCE|nr:hypothetical protein BE17_21020 [Sorangium cellulosum]